MVSSCSTQFAALGRAGNGAISDATECEGPKVRMTRVATMGIRTPFGASIPQKTFLTLMTKDAEDVRLRFSW